MERVDGGQYVVGTQPRYAAGGGGHRPFDTQITSAPARVRDGHFRGDTQTGFAVAGGRASLFVISRLRLPDRQPFRAAFPSLISTNPMPLAGGGAP